MKTRLNKAKPTKLPDFSAETILSHLLHLLHTPNQDLMTIAKKRVGLLMLGVSKEVVDKLCEEAKIDREAIMKQVRARVVRERREMAG